jgi:signal transduction histidine kinase
VTAAGTPRPQRPLPSIGTRLANALVLWSVVWGLAIGAAVWLAAVHEVDELLDDALLESAELLSVLVDELPAASWQATDGRAAPGRTDRFTWQVTAADGSLLLRSARAPAEPWPMAPGFGRQPDWRTYSLALSGGRVLTAAQSAQERGEARSEAALSAVLAALAVGVLGHVWLRARVGAELQPLRQLSSDLERWNPDADPGLSILGEPRARELRPVHQALGSLAQRLAGRLANERALSAHAAHALRTPLAGIDAQLAVALRESPAQLQPRLQRVRDAASRLQTVVAALIGLFRSGTPLNRQPVDLAMLVARLPTPALQVQVDPGPALRADADLLFAALANLLDNALRQGARSVRVSSGPGNTVHLVDDGPGLPPEQHRALCDALERSDGGQPLGLGLVLADRVARAHGGRVRLPWRSPGFAVEIDLGGEGAT